MTRSLCLIEKRKAMNHLNEYLQRLRTERKMSQVEVAKGFQERGYSVTNQMIYNWESGRINISGEMLLVLCDILNISDIRGAFDRNEIPSLTSNLNNDGIKHLSDYADLLRASGLYQKEAAEVIDFPTARIMKLYHLPVSAGNGTYLDNEAYDEIEVGNEVPNSADFGVTISGDSMEPQFVNGQTVWVHAQKELDDGEIGIFFHNDEGFIKKLGYKDGKIFLISLNHRKYEPREIKEGDVFFVFGKVVG